MFRTSPRLRVLALVALAGLGASHTRAQIIIVDRRPEIRVARSFEVKEVVLDARVRDQVAEVQVRQTFHNPGSTEIESEFLFPIPDDAAVQDVVLLADGKELTGRLLDKDEARKVYEEIVRRKRDPALLEYMGRGLFKTSVFPIPPGADRTVTLRYTQLLRRDGDVMEISYPFGTQKFTAKPIERLEFTARIESKEAIKGLYSPSSSLDIERKGDHEATVRLLQRDVIPTADFRLLVTLQPGDVGATVLSYRPESSEDGYFLLLASPKVQVEGDAKPPAKTVVFVLDRSGSMAGKKIEQARASLRFVLENLRDDDLFNIVVYDDRVETYKPELQRYSKEARDAALAYVDNIRPGGSTNISDALKEGLSLIGNSDRPSYLLFLTDGLPTAGDRSELGIAEVAKKANTHEARVFAFGVGYDVNARLLDRLSGQNRGTTEFVKPDEDIEAHVGRFFSRLTSPVLARLAIRFDGTDVNRTYPRDLPDLFEGGQIAWVGRYREGGPAHVELSGKVGKENVEHRFDVDLEKDSHSSRYEFVARLWAVRRIGDILDQIDLNGTNRELTDELVDLSKKYGILTPYTSFLADETVTLSAVPELRREAEVRFREFGQTAGAAGVGQRLAKGGYMQADRADTFAAAPAAVSAPLDAAGQMRGASGGQAQMMGGRSLRESLALPAQAPRANSTGGLAAGMSSAPAPSPTVSMTGPGQLALAKDLEGRDVAVANVRTVAGRTFYRRNGVWVESTLKPEDESKARRVEQFSADYFDLAGKQKRADDNQLLAFTEPVIVRLADGQVYRIDPPAEKPAQ
jgi:Ca-activated chloride channel family protein